MEGDNLSNFFSTFEKDDSLSDNDDEFELPALNDDFDDPFVFSVEEMSKEVENLEEESSENLYKEFLKGTVGGNFLEEFEDLDFEDSSEFDFIDECEEDNNLIINEEEISNLLEDTKQTVFPILPKFVSGDIITTHQRNRLKIQLHHLFSVQIFLYLMYKYEKRENQLRIVKGQMDDLWEKKGEGETIIKNKLIFLFNENEVLTRSKLSSKTIKSIIIESIPFLSKMSEFYRLIEKFSSVDFESKDNYEVKNVLISLFGLNGVDLKSLPLFREDKPSIGKLKFSNSEDVLLTMGVRKFGTRGNWTAIKNHFLPCKNESQISNRYKNMSCKKAPKNNPIRKYKLELERQKCIKKTKKMKVIKPVVPKNLTINQMIKIGSIGNNKIVKNNVKINNNYKVNRSASNQIIKGRIGNPEKLKFNVELNLKENNNTKKANVLKIEMPKSIPKPQYLPFPGKVKINKSSKPLSFIEQHLQFSKKRNVRRSVSSLEIIGKGEGINNFCGLGGINQISNVLGRIPNSFNVNTIPEKISPRILNLLPFDKEKLPPFDLLENLPVLPPNVYKQTQFNIPFNFQKEKTKKKVIEERIEEIELKVLDRKENVREYIVPKLQENNKYNNGLNNKIEFEIHDLDSEISNFELEGKNVEEDESEDSGKKLSSNHDISEHNNNNSNMINSLGLFSQGGSFQSFVNEEENKKIGEFLSENELDGIVLNTNQNSYCSLSEFLNLPSNKNNNDGIQFEKYDLEDLVNNGKINEDGEEI